MAQQTNRLLANKTALITGCRRGIGRAALEVFAANGANVWAHVRNLTPEFEHSAKELSERYGVAVRPIGFDIEDFDAVKTGIKTIFAEKQPIDLLVNNAGIVAESRLFAMTPMEQIRHVMEVNCIAPLFLTQLVSRMMTRQKSGVILFLSSIAGLDGDPSQLDYALSKSALTGAVKKLARELAPFSIRVNAVAPGLIETDMGKQMGDEMRQQTLESVLMKRFGRPEEVANVLLFLASDLASFMTGQIIRVDGGR